MRAETKPITKPIGEDQFMKDIKLRQTNWATISKAFIIYSVLLIATMTLSPRSFAHGDGAQGPHHGYIQMPGAYHTELTVDLDKKEAKVWLLDINFQNPQTVNSEVMIQFVGKNLGDKKILCSTKTTKQQPNNSNSNNSDTNASLKSIHADYFQCSLKEYSKLNSKSIEKVLVFSTRNGVKGMTAEYNWPLRVNSMTH